MKTIKTNVVTTGNVCCQVDKCHILLLYAVTGKVEFP